MSRTDVAVAPTAPRVRDDLRQLAPVLAALMAGLALAELDATMLATALPTVVGELGGSDRLLWATTAYLVTGTVMMPVLGRLGDLLGRRPVFLAALSVLVAGSVLGGLARDLPTLVAARAVRGLGGGALVVLVYAVLADLLPDRRRAPVMTAVGAVFAACAVAGPLLGGWLAETVGWRWVFWINVPVGVLAVVLAARTLPRRRPQGARVHLDAAGTALLAVAVLSLTLLVTVAARLGASGTTLVVGAAVVGLFALALFVVERRARHPLLPPLLFRDRTFVVAVVAGLVLGAAMFGTVGYLPTYLQMAAGLSPRGAGLMMLTLVGGLGGATVVAAQVVARTGRHRFVPVLGAVLTATALALMSRWSADTSLVAVGSCLARHRHRHRLRLGGAGRRRAEHRAEPARRHRHRDERVLPRGGGARRLDAGRRGVHRAAARRAAAAGAVDADAGGRADARARRRAAGRGPRGRGCGLCRRADPGVQVRRVRRRWQWAVAGGAGALLVARLARRLRARDGS